jgi:hypothetical protein
MEAEDIERYLAELGAELKNRGLKKPVRILLIGGAYMLLFANAPRSTKDIDIFLARRRWTATSLCCAT